MLFEKTFKYPLHTGIHSSVRLSIVDRLLQQDDCLVYPASISCAMLAEETQQLDRPLVPESAPARLHQTLLVSPAPWCTMQEVV